MNNKARDLLNQAYEKYHNRDFIKDDPLEIPHLFHLKQDQEIAGFFAATFAWGQRKTIRNKTKELLERMDWSPYSFIREAKSTDLQSLETFKHRTFQPVDLYYFVNRLKAHYVAHDSLESLFIQGNSTKEKLMNFHTSFSNGADFEPRTKKHIATPATGSCCKRLCMFLRWMVRKDSLGIDLGIWNELELKPSSLYCPLDVHVGRVARSLGLINRKQNDWKALEELQTSLLSLDSNDPSKYDFALFGLGLEGEYG